MSANGTFAVYGGLDEAGYGPMLGPLTFGYSAFRNDAMQPAEDWSPDWSRLGAAVSESPKDDAKKLVVADSKKVFTRNPRGSKRLELTALSFLRAAGGAPSCGRSLVDCAPKGLAPTDDELARHPWYANLPAALPIHAKAEDLDARRDLLDGALEASHTTVCAAGLVVIPAGKLNDSFAATGNKGATLWSFNSPVILDLFERFGAEGLDMTVDRLGGRARYGRILSNLIPFSEVRVVSESRSESRYFVSAGDRRMRIRFIQKGDTLSLPVALGSCLAKYARELCMDAFNEHFHAACPDVKPTAGYVTDARRWLTEVEKENPALLQNRDSLIRTR